MGSLLGFPWEPVSEPWAAKEEQKTHPKAKKGVKRNGPRQGFGKKRFQSQFSADFGSNLHGRNLLKLSSRPGAVHILLWCFAAWIALCASRGIQKGSKMEPKLNTHRQNSAQDCLWASFEKLLWYFFEGEKEDLLSDMRLD